MLKIVNLSLISGKQVIRSFDFSRNMTFIKMGNSKGKTSLFSLIDYLLGSSSTKLSSETFQKIERAELYTNHGIFVRSISDKSFFGYKLRQDDGVQVVSEGYYMSQIENACLEGETIDRDSVRALADENITYRTYSMHMCLLGCFSGLKWLSGLVSCWKGFVLIYSCSAVSILERVMIV